MNTPPASGSDNNGANSSHAGGMPSALFDPSGQETAPLGRYAERAYLEYALSVVKGRALPDVCDGQKPVQRRILYAMREMGLHTSGAKPVKSASVVGDVMGKFHPHGDQAIYEAMVRQAQGFVMRYPLVDGQGNFGSRDGDGAAAMRYTEARLTRLAETLLAELGLGTVDWQPTYDGSREEPRQLPSRLPMLLLNGASGIAVGMATEVPPHALEEIADAAIALIKRPTLDTSALLAYVPGPDFPTGGQIISPPEQIQAAYETGRGAVTVRARWRIEELARGQWQLVVYELPPNTSAQKVLEEIEDLVNPKLKKGKKSLTAEQLQTKQQFLLQLDAVRDESGKEVAVRLVFEPKSRNQEPQSFANLLLSYTSLEGNVPINLVAIGLDGRPTQKSLRDLLVEWIRFRFITVRRRSAFRLERVEERIHVLEGRALVFLHLDAVIALIRSADEPKPALIERFALSERQAEDILEIRLRQLARLEGLALERELGELRSEAESLRDLLANEGAMQKLVIQELREDTKRFGDARRTLIETDARASIAARDLPSEDQTVLLSQKGWVRSRSGHQLDLGSTSFKEGDGLLATLECQSTDTLVFFGSDGRLYNLATQQVPGGRGEGVPLASLLELGPSSRIMRMARLPGDSAAATRWVLASSAAYAFLCSDRDWQTRQRAGKAFVTLKAGESLLPPLPLSSTPSVPVSRETAGAAPLARRPDLLCCLSSSQRLLVFPLAELPTLPKGGRGMQAMQLDKNEQLRAWGLGSLAEGATLYGYDAHGSIVPWQLSGKQLHPYLGSRTQRGKRLEQNLL